MLPRMSIHVQEINDDALRLLCIDGLGGHTLSSLICRAGGLQEAAEAVLCDDAKQWFPQCAIETLKGKMRRMEIDAARWSSDAVNASIVSVMDDEFPKLLRPLPSCPACLWCRGSLKSLQTSGVAIVGSRRCSNYGIAQAQTFSKNIASANLTIISGGARGIDAVAHRSALHQGGITVAVLGSGLSVVYPPEHAKLFDSIVGSGGAVISEFPCHRPPQPAYFPRRNRIVAGLSSAVLVIEAARRSGALITARIAVEEHGRHGFAVPGRLDDPSSSGCLKSILDGWLELAITPERVIEEANDAWKRLSSHSIEFTSNFEERL